MDPTLCRPCLDKGYECPVNDWPHPSADCPPGTCGVCDYEREAGQ